MTAFFTRPWNRRLTRYAAWSLITLVTLYALLCALVNWTGSRRWAATKAMLAREGETLDFNKLLLPPVDDARNFCAIEPLRDITLPDDEKSAPSLKRAALEGCGWKPSNDKKEVPSMKEGPAFGRRADIHEWAAFARASKYADMPAASGNEARDLLVGMDASHPLLKQLAEVAAARPESLFVPVLPPSSPLLALGFPHFHGVRTVSSALALRAIAASESGDHTAATQSAQAALHFADAAQREPFLIGLLVAVTLHETAEEAIWAILEKRQATEAELLALQTSLTKLDFHKATLVAMRGEMVAAIDSLDYVQAGPYRIQELTGSASDGGASSRLGRLLWGLVPAGVFDHNKAVVATMEFEQCIRPLKQGTTQDLPWQRTAFEEELKAHRRPLHPDYFFANLVMPAISRVVEKTFAAEALRRQALTACALERYYIQHHAYPASLSELTPALLAAVPTDPMDDQPLRYLQTSDGRYMLWSVGLDLKDDGGKVIPHAGTLVTTTPYKRGYQGDWTWQYQPVK